MQRKESLFQKASWPENPYNVLFDLFPFCVITDLKKCAFRILLAIKLGDGKI